MSVPAGQATYRIVFLGDGGELLLGAFDTPASGVAGDRADGTDPDALADRLRRRLAEALRYARSSDDDGASAGQRHDRDA